ncbi:MAG: hypothetical protein EOP42_26155 [Sphingobacteriaceae bacterium]|nr:MAG: hypothetical protein EOP42_26155 [Sphingobacteriaceae bacterium]
MGVIAGIISIVSGVISGVIAYNAIHKAKHSDKITFIKGDKMVTISTNQDPISLRKQLVSL